MSKYFNMDGYVCGEVESRTTASGKHVTQFTLNSPERFKEGEEWKSRANFFKCQYWHRGDHDYRADYIYKGEHLQVSGEPRFEEWEDRNGNKRSIVRFNVQNILLIAKKEKSQDVQYEVDETSSVYDEDIPF